MNYTKLFTLLGFLISIIGVNFTFLSLYWNDLREDVDRLEDRIEFLTKIVLRNSDLTNKYEEIE